MGQPWDNMGNPIVPESDDAAAEYGIWGLASMRLDLFPGGMVRAVGWTDEFDTGLFEGESVDRHRRIDGRTHHQ